MTQTNKKYENSSLEASHRQKADDNKTAITEQQKKTLQKKDSVHASFEAVGHIDMTDSDPTSKRATRGYANFDIDEDKQIQFSGSGWRVERAGAVLYHQHRILPLTFQNF